MLSGVIFLFRFIRKNKIDVVHSNTTAVWVGGIAAMLARIPHIQHVREIILEPRLFWCLTAWNLRLFSTRIIGVSAPVIDHLVTVSRGIRKKSRVIHNGIDTKPYDRIKLRQSFRSELDVPPDRVVIGMIARVTPWKGQKFFIKAAERFLDDQPEGANPPLFVLVGSAFQDHKEREAELQRTLDRSTHRDCFSNFGFREDVPVILAGLDIFTLPSTSPDPLPTTVLEAMASSLPVVANGFGGSIEMIVDGKTGFLITPNSADELVERWRRLCADRRLREQMGNEGRKRVEEMFTYDKYVKNVARIFEEVVDAHN
jgi:glycosyltransferase involved in cell wall biosynthesis